MKAENEAQLKRLGWIRVEDKFPPLGKEINVCQADDYTQGIWSQSFKSEAEVRASGITHWAESRKKK